MEVEGRGMEGRGGESDRKVREGEDRKGDT